MSVTYLVRWIPLGHTRVLEEVRDAVSSQILRLELESTGGKVLHVAPLPKSRDIKRLSPRSQDIDVTWWCKELATLLRAGMTVVEAVETMQLQSTGGSRANAQQILLKALHEGKSLSQAMLKTGLFPKVLVASVTASERTSTLVVALEDYLRYDLQMQGLRKQAIGAAIYPSIVITFGFLISLFLLLFVIPRFSKMYGTFHARISGATSWILSLSHFVQHSMPMLFLLSCLLLALTLLAWQLRWWHALAGMAAENLPVLRDATKDFRASQLYQSLALTLRGGFPLIEALQVCESLGLGPKMMTALARVIPAIERGQAASQAFVEAGLADFVAERLLRVGERNGQFPEVLQALADRHAQSFSTFVQRATRLIEPLLLVSVALMVGGIVVMMYMPIFDIANGMR